MDLLAAVLLLSVGLELVWSQYSCSSRPDGECPPCDCTPDCFDLSDEVNCTGKVSIHDVIQPHLVARNVQQENDNAMKFFPPPPLPPFRLCPEKTTTQQPITTTTQQLATTTIHLPTTTQHVTTATTKQVVTTTILSSTPSRPSDKSTTTQRTTVTVTTEKLSTPLTTVPATTDKSTTTAQRTTVTATTDKPLTPRTTVPATPVTQTVTSTTKQVTTTAKTVTTPPQTTTTTAKSSGKISRWFCAVITQQYYRRCRSYVYRFDEYCDYMVKVLRPCRRLSVVTTQKPTTTTIRTPPTFSITIGDVAAMCTDLTNIVTTWLKYCGHVVD